MTTTINELFIESATAAPHRSAYMFRNQDGSDGWTHLTYGDALTRVEHLGAALLDLGVVAGDRVAILSNTRIEWTISDYAVLGTGATVVPIYQTNSPSEVQHVVADSGATMIILEDASQLAKIDEIRDHIPSVATIIVMDTTGIEARIDATTGTYSFADVEQRGTALDTSVWRAASAAVTTDTIATIIYTSGTTGAPKGCMLSHANMWQSVENVATANPTVIRNDDRIVLFLPLAHILARIIQLAATKLHGECAYTSIATLIDDMAEIKPTLLPSVPRVFEKAHTRIMGQLADATGAKKSLIDWALSVGRKRNHYKWVLGRSVPLFVIPQYAIAQKLVFSKIQARFGGNLRMCVSGGAPLSREIQEFFLAAGIPIFEGYGLTEATPLTLNIPGSFQLGSIGRALGDTEIRIADDGEILARSQMVFTGYYNNPEATAETRDADGWLHTGDIGEVDRHGFVYITDRKKDIIITAGGKNVAPQNIENALKATRLVSQALVYGDRKPYLTALITIDPEEAVVWAKEHGVDGSDMLSLIGTSVLQDAIRSAVTQVNDAVGRVEQIKRYRILPIDFSQATGELTPTLKLKRKLVTERFQDIIEAMYESDAAEAESLTDASLADRQDAVTTPA